MRVWVTGASGFLGSRVAHGLAGRHEVVALTRGDVDLAAPEAVDVLRSLPAPDVVVHLAARVPRGPVTNAAYVESNVLATGRLLDALTAFEPRRLVFTSTLTVYGHAVANPVGPDTPAEPSHPYGIAKRAAEQLVQAAPSPERLVLRLPSLYGRGQADSFVDGLARTILAGETLEVFAGGRTLRDALHVDDAADAVIRAVEAELPAGATVLHAGVGRPLSTADWAEALRAAFESSVEIVPVERGSTQAIDLYADVSAAGHWLGWGPRELDVALRAYADELRAAR